ncbi:response regulator [Pseudoalteromonas xiamenensis]|uniref:Response regulator n=1 Tax=Pseudoalteromonas xiamenensis TaxID=882626 RepID=A0A975DFV4_9GAMM|nr:response regulator [Pseudoalteromonas xiamenensis]QTH70905.1 response regulator [Pseudoalteromonas xiamenensis]
MSYSVLVCDDSTVARKQVKRCLQASLDVDIVEAQHGAEALALLQSKQIDLVCLDLTMPVVDGIGVLEGIKEQKIESFVVVISADIQSEMKAKVASLGALDFIEKPVKPDSLLSVLHKFGIR